MSILSDVKDVEAKVRESMQNGPVTPYYTFGRSHQGLPAFWRGDSTE